MRLESIQLTNFRQYFGNQTAEFSSEVERNVTVFHGLNGAGKTSLFSAINWCLYNAAVEGIGELVNKEAVAQSREGDTVLAEVTITFRHEDKRFIAKRFLAVRRIFSGTAPADTGFSLTQIEAGGNGKVVANPIAVMNSILAANVRPYFFFDGERMEDLTRAGNDEVRDAVRNIMRLPMLESAERHLNDVAAEYRRDIRKQGSPELDRLISEEERIRAAKEFGLKRRDEIKLEIAKARERVESLSNKLRATEGAHALQKRRDEIRGELERWEKVEREHTVSIQEVVNRAYLRFLAEPAQKALEILDQKRERGEIPSGIREQVVKDLLEKHECICGRSFTDHDAVYEKLVSLLQRATTPKLELEVSNLAGSIRALSAMAENQQTTLAALARERQEVKQQIERLYEERTDIDHQLREMTTEDIAGLERLRKQIQDGLERSIAEQANNEARLGHFDQQLEEIKKKKSAAEAKEQKLALLKRCDELAQKAADAVGLLKKEFFEETRRNVEAATKEVFARLAWKQEHFQDVRIDEDFRLEVIDRWGTPTRKELSAGERQILSLSFICAMSQMSGEEAPLVMDTPFGRLSGNHLGAVAENLPNLTRQLILFVTDREWDEASRTNLEPRAGRQYKLEFNAQTGCTQIVEVK